MAKSYSITVIPGRGITLGFTLTFLSVIVLLPIMALFLYSFKIPMAQIMPLLQSRQFVAALQLSLLTAFAAACLNSVLGLIIAWSITRYQFRGKSLLDASIDLPFALPTSVAGITLTTIYQPHGVIGHYFPFAIAYTPLGIIVVLLFVTLPFVVRTLQPVIADLPHEIEEAAAILGASRFAIFYRLILPIILPAWLTGFALAFARGLGEYGSVIFIAGNIPYRTEILPLLIVSKLDQYDYACAVLIGIIMLIISFILLLLINLLQRKLALFNR